MAARSPDDFPGRYVRVPGPCKCWNPDHYITLDYSPANPNKEEDNRDRLKNRHHPYVIKKSECIPATASQKPNAPYQPYSMENLGIEANFDYPHHTQQYGELGGLPTRHQDALSDTELANAFINPQSTSMGATSTDTDTWPVNPTIVPQCSSAFIEIPPALADIDSWLSSEITPSSVPCSESTFVPFDTHNDEPPSNSDINSWPTSVEAPSAGSKFKYTFVPVETHIDKLPAYTDMQSLPTRARTPSSFDQYINTYATTTHIDKLPAYTDMQSLPTRARTPSSFDQYINTYATTTHIDKPPAYTDMYSQPTRARAPSSVAQFTFAKISHIDLPPANTDMDSPPRRARAPSALAQFTFARISHIDLPPANVDVDSQPTRAKTSSAVAQYMNTLTTIAHIDQPSNNAVIDSRLTSARTPSTITQYINTFALIGHIDKPAASANINARSTSGMLGCCVLDERPPDHAVIAARLKSALAASALTDLKPANASRPATALFDAICTTRPTVTQHTSVAIASFTDTHATSVKTQLERALLLPASATNSYANKCDDQRPRHQPTTLAGARLAAALAERRQRHQAHLLQRQPDHADKYYYDGSKKYL